MKKRKPLATKDRLHKHIHKIALNIPPLPLQLIVVPAQHVSAATARHLPVKGSAAFAVQNAIGVRCNLRVVKRGDPNINW